MLPALDLSGKAAVVIGGASGTPGNSGETFGTETLLLRTPWVATWSLRAIPMNVTPSRVSLWTKQHARSSGGIS